MHENFRFTPIQKLLQNEALKPYPHLLKVHFARVIVAQCRKNKEFLDENALILRIQDALLKFYRRDFQSLINATGVILHTNLGRSLIDKQSFEACKNLICFHSNLEFDLKSGKRGSRYGVVLEKLKILFDCEDALIVNNNAAAVFLVLNSLARDAELITSKGELVEIGGGFRMSEVIRAAGSRLIEVGTSNKTHLEDYAKALSESTALILKTHKSNFTLAGFHGEVGIEDLGALARKRGLWCYYDLGSGWCGKLESSLAKNEPEIKKVLKHCDVLSFSGDKLFGSVQAGIILGKSALIDKMRQNQLLRMLRVDKITLAFLNESLRAYLEKSYAKIPTLKLLNDDLAAVKKKALWAQARLKITSALKTSRSLVGAGSMPGKSLPTAVLALEGEALSLQERMREKNIIARVEDGRAVLDFRSVLEEELESLVGGINAL